MEIPQTCGKAWGYLLKYINKLRVQGRDQGCSILAFHGASQD